MSNIYRTRPEPPFQIEAADVTVFIGLLLLIACNANYSTAYAAIGPIGCAQVLTDAWNPSTNEVRIFSTPCDVPAGWIYPVPDSDGDGWLDSVEVANGSNRFDRTSTPPDIDHDFVIDNVDNCPTTANRDQRDTDRDGIGDACDPSPGCDIPAVILAHNVITGATNNFESACLPQDWAYGIPDSDGDHYDDAVELRYGSDPHNPASTPPDQDGDFIPDIADPDIDGDLILNAYDNCPAVKNADQLDTDGDKLGDACHDPLQKCAGLAEAWNLFTGESKIFPTSCFPGGWAALPAGDSDRDGWDDLAELQLSIRNNDSIASREIGMITNSAMRPFDQDGDGIDNSVDNCPALYNKEQTDTDGNGTGDVCDSKNHDATPPTLNVPANITREATGPLTKVYFGLPSVTDDRFQQVTVWPDTYGPFTPGSHPVVWTARDFAGNGVSHIQTVTIVDTTAPIVTAPPDKELPAGAVITSGDLGLASAIDLVSGALRPVVATNLSTLVTGINRITWRATDNAGNAGEATQVVTLVAAQKTEQTSVTANAEPAAKKAGVGGLGLL